MISSLGRLFRSLKLRAVFSLSALRERASEIKAGLRESTATPDDGVSIGRVLLALEVCRESIEGILAQTGAALQRLSGQRAAAADYFRLMQASHGEFRLPNVPDSLVTILITMLFWLLEGGMAGAILISEGRMDVPAGLTYGLIFALVNIILGLLIGYLPLRYLSYRSPVDLLAPDDGQERERAARVVRRLALFSLFAGLAAEAVLIYGAARLRALGTHEGVFDFSEVGFWETFDDSLAIIIVVIGACSVVIATLKGFRGLDDPIPGFSSAYRQATADVDEAAEDIAEQAEETIDEACERALEVAEDALTDARDSLEDGTARLHEIARAIDLFNDDVRSAQDAVRARGRKDRNVAAFVSGAELASPTQDETDAYEALILPGIERKATRFRTADATEIARAEAAMTELEAARDRCLGQIRADLAAFRSHAPTLDVLMHEGGHNG